jgi:hypothetical protein
MRTPVPIEDLRQRVREAEALLGVARGLAKDELHDPASCERARDRIMSILREIDLLIPGLGDPPPPIDPIELVAPSMRNQPAQPGPGDDEEERDDEDGDDEEEEDEDEEQEEEHLEDSGGDEDASVEERDEEVWSFDRHKLAAALESDFLMSKIPEMDREWFKRLARRTIEAQERLELCDRVKRAFDELGEAMREGLNEASRQLSVALTFQQLRIKLQQ